MKIRSARLADAPDIALLAGQLGYPTSTDQASERLQILLASNEETIFVAEAGDSHVIGWVHVHARPSLIEAPFAELGALVVDETRRGAGVGQALAAAAEAWASARGYTSLWVRSNIVRERAHHFYERLDYRRLKTQHVFVKILAPNT